MKIIKKEKQTREVEFVIEEYKICDKCNEEIKIEDKNDIFECKFIHKTGSLDSGYWETQDIHLCKKCAVDTVLLFSKNGYRINEAEYYF